MNRFNKRQGTLLKKRREMARVVKKRKGVAQLHRTVAQASSGKRTGKSAKKRERAVRLKVLPAKPNMLLVLCMHCVFSACLRVAAVTGEGGAIKEGAVGRGDEVRAGPGSAIAVLSLNPCCCMR